MTTLIKALPALLLTVGCSSSSGPAADTTSLNGAGGPLVGSGTLTGTYGSEAIPPIIAAYWVGQPDDPTESAGGPFVNLFSTPVTCNQISVNGWLSKIP